MAKKIKGGFAFVFINTKISPDKKVSFDLLGFVESLEHTFDEDVVKDTKILDVYLKDFFKKRPNINYFPNQIWYGKYNVKTGLFDGLVRFVSTPDKRMTITPAPGVFRIERLDVMDCGDSSKANLIKFLFASPSGGAKGSGIT